MGRSWDTRSVDMIVGLSDNIPNVKQKRVTNMKRKDWYTIAWTIVFVIVILFSNILVAQAHDGPEMIQYLQEVQEKKEQDKAKDVQKKKKRCGTCRLINRFSPSIMIAGL